MRTASLLAVAALLSAAFGVTVWVVQGHSAAGWYLANFAGVWLAVAFVFGALAARRDEACLAGLCAEMSALGGYYGWMHFGQHQHQPLSHVVFWSCCGLLAGPVFGQLGYRWRRRRSEIAGIALGVAFVCEAIVLGLTQARPRSVAALEIVAGVLLAAMLFVAARWRKSHSTPISSS